MNPNLCQLTTFQPHMGFERTLNDLDVALKLMDSQR